MRKENFEIIKELFDNNETYYNYIIRIFSNSLFICRIEKDNYTNQLLEIIKILLNNYENI